jgi:hypothetical protein
MKQKYFLRLISILTIALAIIHSTNAQTQGDIAFVGFNADGDSDFAIVVLTDILANTTIYFTDDETTGIGTPSALAGSEGVITWSTGSNTITAGTVVVFTDVDSGTNPSFGVSIGSISRSGSFNLSGSKDGIIAFLGSDSTTPTTYIAAIQIGNDNTFLGPFDGDAITLTNTSLAIGTSIIVVDNTASPDGGIYTGSRSSEVSFSSYYSLISNSGTNWSTQTTNGELSLPFSQEAFTINTTNWTGASSSVWNLSGNWDNGIPTSSSLVTIPNVTTSPIISSGTEATAGNLTIDSGENLTLNSVNSLTVSGALSIDGGLTLNSSSSIIVGGTSTGNITYNRNIGTTNWYLISSPLVGQTIVDFYTNESPALGSGTGDTQNVAIAPYDNSQAAAADRWAYYTKGQVDGADGEDTTDTFASGTGYSIKMQASGDIAFTGTIDVVDTGVDVSITSSVNAFNLIGNPYPSYIPANSNADGTNNILTINTASLTEDTIWFWDQSTSSYDQVNQASASMFISPSQGFFVSSTGANTFNFEESMQSHQSTDTFQRTTTTRPEVNLLMTNGTDVRDTDIFYIDGTTTGFDNGYDSSIFGGIANPFAIYTHAVANGTGKNLGIQSLPDNDVENIIIPVGVNAVSGSEIIISAEAINLPSGINVYLEDKETAAFTKLDASSYFTTILTSDLNGIGRFYLHTTSQVLSTDEVNLNNISIYAFSNNNLRIVGVQNGTAKVKLYNILGKQILATSFQGNGVNDITIPNVRTGIYIIQLETETGKLNKKVILE